MKPVSGKNGFAIVSVLLVVAVLTIMVVAFMQSMRIDRLTALAYLNKTKAEMAAEAGIQNAISALMDATQGDRAYVVAVELPDPDTSAILVIRKAVTAADGTITLEDHALMSGTRDADTGNLRTIEQLNTARVEVGESLNLNGPEGWIRDFSANADANVNFYRAPMEDLSDGNGDVSSRYAFQILDEQARLNPRLHRGEVRQWGASTAEIPLSLGVIPETAEPLLTAAELATLGSILPLIPTPGSMGQAFSTTQRFAERKHLFGLYTQPNEDVIPHGYADAGLPKYNINDLAVNPVHGATATLRAEKIATLIDRNLPQFKNRDPSFATAGVPNEAIKYVNRLAASIVDYIDSDDLVTSVNGSEPAGKELAPLVVGAAENFQWLSKGNAANNFTSSFQSRYYLQLWNPYTQNVTGSVRLEILERPPLKIGSAIERNLSDYNQTVNNVTLRPNEFVVVEFSAANESNYISIVDPESSSANRPRWEQTSSTNILRAPHPYFKMYWNGQLADMNRRPPEIANVGSYPSTSGLPKGVVSTTPSNMNSISIVRNRWSVHFIQKPAISGQGNRRVPEPRINYLSNFDWTEWVNTSYANGRWGGSQDHSSTTQDFITLMALRDPIPRNPNLGASSSNISQTPSQIAAGSGYSETVHGRNAPFYIRNAEMESIGELGHIFDPSQAADNGESSPTSISAGPFSSGGGRTLRIGQPEFQFEDPVNWNVEGRRAIQLIDLFTTRTADAVTGYPQQTGLININTAEREVLMALFQNIEVSSDAGVTAGRINAAKAAVLADAIIDNRPYYRLSDLHNALETFVRSDTYEPKLGAGPNADPALVMDRAREELFTKMISLVTVQSRTFRIYSAGVAVDGGPSKRVRARAFSEAVVELIPTVAADGSLTFTPRILNQRIL